MSRHDQREDLLAADPRAFDRLLNVGKPFLTGGALDTLIAMIERGPLESGDIPSKAGRGELLAAGLAVQVVAANGEYVCAATVKGAEAFIKLYGGQSLSEAKRARQGVFERSQVTDAARTRFSFPVSDQCSCGIGLCSNRDSDSCRLTARR